MIDVGWMAFFTSSLARLSISDARITTEVVPSPTSLSCISLSCTRTRARSTPTALYQLRDMVFRFKLGVAYVGAGEGGSDGFLAPSGYDAMLTWDFHVEHVLRVSLECNLEMIADSVAFLASSGRRVVYDAEHFFDGWKANPEHARATLVGLTLAHDKRHFARAVLLINS